MVSARRHVSIHLSGDGASQLDQWRERWDPVMATLTPPHVTVVYTEETINELVLLADQDPSLVDDWESLV